MSRDLFWRVTAVKKGAIPPLAIFNDFMSCGVDDMDHDSVCLDVEDKNFNAASVNWEPFELTESEYEKFLSYIRKSGESVEVKDYNVSTYQEWFEKCFS